MSAKEYESLMHALSDIGTKFDRLFWAILILILADGGPPAVDRLAKLFGG